MGEARPCRRDGNSNKNALNNNNIKKHTGAWQTDAEFIANDRATCELPGGSATGSYWLYLSHGRGWRPPPTGGKEGGGVRFTM